MKQRWYTAAVVLGLLAYIVAFYFAPLSSMRDSEGQPMVRTDIVVPFALHPYQGMITSWFGSPAQFTFADRLPVLATAGAILAWAFAVGRLLLMAGRVDRELTRLETFVFSTAVGLNGLSTWMLAVGLLGCLDRTWVVIVPMAVTLVIYAAAWYCRKKCDRRSAGNESADEDRIPPIPPSAGEANAADVHWLWLALPFCLAIVLTAMLPPTDFDVCVYHLQAPKEFLQQGRVSFLPHNVFANMPLGSEMLSMLAMVCMEDWWWGALAGKTVLAAFSPLCALAIFAAGRRWRSAPAGAIAALVYISTPWVVSVSSAGLVEGVLACYTFLAIFAFMRFNTQQATEDCEETRAGSSTGLLALSGYLAGSAVATKYPALLFLLIPLVVAIVVVVLAKNRGIAAEAASQAGCSSRLLQTTAKRLAVFLLAVGLGCGLWFAKNWATTGNPTFPLLYEVFGGATWSDAKNRQWNEAHRPHDFSIASLGECVERVVLTSEWISLLAAPLAAMALFRKRIPRFAWALLLYVGFVIAIWWMFAPRVDRFWMPMTPVLALLAGMGACWSCERWWRRTLAGLLLLGLATSFLMVASDRENAWFLPLDRLRSDPNWISPWHWYLNQKTADSEAVLVVGTPAVFHLKPRVYYNTCFDDCILEELVKDKSPEEIRRALAEKDVAYVLVAWDAIARYRSTHGFTDFVQPEVFDRLVRQGILTPLPPMQGIDQRVYRVSRPPASEKQGG